MALTPLDIRKTEFTRRLRGLDPDEVSAYLELVAREVEVAHHEVQMREERIRDLEGRLQHYERIELALEEALRTTRESSRQVMEAAHQKAERVHEEAEQEAARIQADAERENRRLRQEAQAIAVRRKEVVARLRAFLMSEMEVLAHFEGEDPVGFIKLMPNADALLGTGGAHDLPEATSAGAMEAPAAPEASAPQAPAEAAGATPPVFEAPAPAFSAPQVVSPDVPPALTWEEALPDADHPTPLPEPVAVPATSLPPEFEAYFQGLETPSAAASDEAPPATDEHIYFPQDPVEPETPSVHAHEPGEPPVPPATPETWASPEATMGWPGPGAPEAAPGVEAPEGWAATEDWGPPEPPAAVAPEQPEDAPQEREAQPAAPAPPEPAPFDVRAVRRERYRIETILGPSVPPVNAAESDQSEESAHLRRLLDGLT